MSQVKSESWELRRPFFGAPFISRPDCSARCYSVLYHQSGRERPPEPSSSSSFPVLQTGCVGWDGYELTTDECRMKRGFLRRTAQNIASRGGTSRADRAGSRRADFASPAAAGCPSESPCTCGGFPLDRNGNSKNSSRLGSRCVCRGTFLWQSAPGWLLARAPEPLIIRSVGKMFP